MLRLRISFKMRVLVAICFMVSVAQAIESDDVQIIPKEPGNLSKKGLGIQVSTESRIIGGDEAIPGQFPYQAGLLVTTPQNTGFCGGSILHEDWVLTAAHCVYTAISVELIIGAHNIVDGDPDQIRVQAKRVIVHENFVPSAIVNDIALLELPWPLEYSNRVQPIRLPRLSQVSVTFEQEIGIVSGWGRDSDISTDLSPVLRWIQNPIMDHQTCTYFYFQRILDSLMCLEGTEIRSPCDGDAGGPLVVVDQDGELIQVGIVSFGMAPICTLAWPSIFTRTSSYLDWIETNTGGSVFARS